MPQEKRFVNFDAAGDEHRQMRLRCAKACRAYNDMAEDALPDERAEKWCAITGQKPVRPELTPTGRTNAWQVPYVKGPIWCDYGSGISIGRTTFVNRDCLILDTTVSKVIIGEDCSIGPRVSIFSVAHPKDRRFSRGPLAIASMACDVVIKDNCWIGGGATILPGVTIGEGAVIGACAVVTKDIPPYHVAYGNPAKIRGTVAPDVPLDPEVMRESAALAMAAERFPHGLELHDVDNAHISGRSRSMEHSPERRHHEDSPIDTDGAPVELLAKLSKTHMACQRTHLKISDSFLYLICGLSFLLSVAAIVSSWCLQ